MSRYSAGYQRTVVLLLMAAYAFNSMDRNIISIIAPAIKSDLGLTDAEVALLGGTAFALLYPFGGIPIARLAERMSRVNILTVSLIVWSCLTGLCAAATGFGQLLMIRVGIGVAESGCSPPAHSLISDYIEPQRRASALSVYTGGISIGYILAAAVGGYIAQHAGWRAACAAVAVPGIVTALVIKAVMREPLRGGADPEAAGSQAAASRADRAVLPPFSIRAELAEFKAVAAALIFDRPILHMVLGLTIGGFAGYGFYFFIPSYLGRQFDLDSASVGLISAMTGGIAVGIGILMGGWVSDRLARSSPRWYAWVPALGGAISLPFYAISILADDWRAAAGALALAGFFWYTSLGPTFGVIQNVVGAHRRATATAFLYICLSVIALGLGPLCVGWVIDRWAAWNFSTTGFGAFGTSCPGGMAPATADALLRSACRSSLASASRRGLLLAAGFFGWAVLHYWRAGVGIDKSLRASLAEESS